MANDIRFDAPAVTADHVDGRATFRSPALDGAIGDFEVPNSGEFDAVVIAIGSDVADPQSTQRHMMRTLGVGSRAAVINVESIVREFGKHEVAQLNKRRIRQMDPQVRIAKNGRLLRVRRSVHNGAACFTPQVR